MAEDGVGGREEHTIATMKINAFNKVSVALECLR
jgi:hypothetical protein